MCYMEYLVTWNDGEGDVGRAVAVNLGKPMDEFRAALVQRFKFFPFPIRASHDRLIMMGESVRGAIIVRVDEEGIVRWEDPATLMSGSTGRSGRGR